MKKLFALLSLTAIVALIVLSPFKAKALYACGFTCKCFAVSGINPTATLVGTNGTDRDLNGYWHSGQTTNALFFYSGDILHISIPTNIACDGNSHLVARIACVNPNTGFSHIRDLYMEPCAYSAWWTIGAYCSELECSVSETLSPSTIQWCPEVGVCSPN